MLNAVQQETPKNLNAQQYLSCGIQMTCTNFPCPIRTLQKKEKKTIEQLKETFKYQTHYGFVPSVACTFALYSFNFFSKIQWSFFSLYSIASKLVQIDL